MCCLADLYASIGGVWIMKPIGAAQGKGIFLFSKLSEISEWKNTDAARYNGGKRYVCLLVYPRFVID